MTPSPDRSPNSGRLCRLPAPPGPPSPRAEALRGRSGLTLFELLVAVALLGIIAAGIAQILGRAVQTRKESGLREELLAQASYAMERMAMFAQETDSIALPLPGQTSGVLSVSEHLLDMFDNTTKMFVDGGDGWLDADINTNMVVNEGWPDLPGYVVYLVNSNNPANLTLEESLPDIKPVPGEEAQDGTNATLSRSVICEQVRDFRCTLVSSNLLEIQLSVGDGTHTVALKTRVSPRNLPR